MYEAKSRLSRAVICLSGGTGVGGKEKGFVIAFYFYFITVFSDSLLLHVVHHASSIETFFIFEHI